MFHFKFSLEYICFFGGKVVAVENSLFWLETFLRIARMIQKREDLFEDLVMDSDLSCVCVHRNKLPSEVTGRKSYHEKSRLFPPFEEEKNAVVIKELIRM
ncbi:hypothetical protein AVEN_58317-1 [Araneus ventricosus]|uniref:Uncharacterized protein n=1 Tax=Araneus ventricosus TaxID=182803 RepID=A0A4Y2CRE0_ARAVE|nr:hypothetical protein AVEN_58317-1 [Araneus ventricosus]